MSIGCRRALLGGLLAVVACGEDFTLVAPAPLGPVLNVTVEVTSDQTTDYEVRAFFFGGTDAGGDPTALADSALYIDGTPILPEWAPRLGGRLYHWQRESVPDGDGGDSVRFVFPAIAGSSASAYGLTVPIRRRVGPASVVLTRGEDLVLQVSPGDRTPPELSAGQGFWLLDLRDSCAGGSFSLFSLSGQGRFPAELRVPRQWLQAVPVGPMAACFRAFADFETVGSPYPASVTIAARFIWRIEVREP